MWNGARMAEFDPQAIAVRPAATVMLVRQRGELEVLMLRRNTRSVFVGDMWVFPGGGVDVADRDPSLYDRLRGVDLESARHRLGIDDAPAYWVATIRETFEEAGVLAVLEHDDTPMSADRLATGEFDPWRDSLNAGTSTMREFLDATGLHLDGSRLAYVARFITPVGPPRRYDARFFLAHAPDDHVASVDNDEAVGHAWVTPSAALARHAAGSMAMMTPTLACLRRLATYPSADEAIHTAQSGVAVQEMRIDLSAEGLDRVVFIDDDHYDASSPSEFGWLGF